METPPPPGEPAPLRPKPRRSGAIAWNRRPDRLDLGVPHRVVQGEGVSQQDGRPSTALRVEQLDVAQAGRFHGFLARTLRS